MASNSNLTVTISAVDLTSQAIDAVARKLGGITAPAKKVTGSLARLSDASGITRLSKAVAQLGGSTAGTGLRLVNALGPLSGLTAALSLGGLAKMTTDWARFSQGLGFDAARIGSSVSDLHALEGSARLSGSSAEAAANGLRTLQDTMTDTAGGRNMEALVYFRQLGVAFDDGRGHALRATAVLPKLADAISKIKDPSLQARVATQFFGGAAESMLPWLRRGSAGMAEYAEMARHYGVQTEAGSDKAGVFRLAQTRLSLAFEGLGNSISEKVSPPLAKMMTYIAELVNKWRGPISDTLGNWARQAGEWVEKFDWTKAIQNIEDMAARFKTMMDKLSSYRPPAWLRWVLRQFSSDDDEQGRADGPHGMQTENYKPTTEGVPRGDSRSDRIKSGIEQYTGINIGRGATNKSSSIPSYLPHIERGDGAGLKNAVQDYTGIDIGRSALPRGLRNNNPLNLSYLPGQGALRSDGRFGVYATMEEGIAADARQMARYTDTGSDTLRKVIYRWAPPSDNDTPTYLKHVTDALGIDADTRVDMHDPSVTAALIAVMTKLENGRMLPMDVVRHGVELASKNGRVQAADGRVPSPGGNVQADSRVSSPSGNVQVDVNIRGLPTGATAVTTTTGNVRGGVRVARAMQ